MKKLVLFLMVALATGPVFATSELSRINAQIEQTKQQNKKLTQRVQTSEREVASTKKKLVRAGDAIENDFTIKKLTRGNPTMKRMFAEERLRKEETQARMAPDDSEAPPE